MNDDSLSNIEEQIRHQGALTEDVRDQVARLAEALADVPGTLTELKSDVEELKSDMKIVKAAVTDQSGQLQNHEVRITSLEQKVA